LLGAGDRGQFDLHGLIDIAAAVSHG